MQNKHDDMCPCTRFRAQDEFCTCGAVAREEIVKDTSRRFGERLHEIQRTPSPQQRTAIEPAPDLAAENDRLRKALEFVQLWAWRDDPPNAARNLSDSERLSAIKYHPSIVSARAAMEKEE